VIAIDPGVHYFAFAIFALRGALIECGMTDHTQPVPGKPYLGPFVIESQFIDRDSRVNTQDVIRLAQSAGRIAANYPEAVWYLPAQWKGGVPKAVHQKRILAALSDEEKALLKDMNKGTLKQVLDAIGLGLYHLGRL
jgi:hypothetical protein